ncbi:MAG: hypothetical protein M2R46_00511 [Verrucomicrobia subdivision 3 bacterium]|nr:hypothetical protein [Limisphaerales bacterium]
MERSCCSWMITPHPPSEAPARNRVDNALYPEETFAAKLNV